MFTRSLRLSILLAIGFSIHLNANEVPLAEVTRQANAGDVQAARNLGQAYLGGHGVPQSVEQGLGWLQKGVAKRDPLSAYALAQYYESLPQTTENRHAVLDNYSRAATWGHTDAQVKIGDLLLTQSIDTHLTENDRLRARTQGKALLEFAANAGNAHAARHLGDIYSTGEKGIPANHATSITYYQRAADAGDGTSAMLAYEQLVHDAKGKHLDVTMAVRYLQVAADKEVPEAQLQFAQRLERGDGVSQDRGAALSYAKRAATNGVPQANALVDRLTPPQPLAEPALVAEAVAAPATPPNSQLPVAAPAKAPPIGDPAGAAPDQAAATKVPDPGTSGVARSAEKAERTIDRNATVAKDTKSEKLHDENVMLRDQLTEREQSLIELRAERDEARKNVVIEHDKLVAALAVQRESHPPVLVADKVPTKASSPARAAPLVPSVSPDTLNENAVLALQSGNYESAIHNFKLAADAGSQRAINNLGMLYYRGVGVDRNMATAIDFFEKAAAAGNGSAANNLGFIFQNGEGVRADARAAIRWYTMAIQLGNKASLGNLQKLLASGVTDSAPSSVVGEQVAGRTNAGLNN
jgi:TPR repeat protein